jgi:hypothetical protein
MNEFGYKPNALKLYPVASVTSNADIDDEIEETQDELNDEEGI